MFYGNQGKVSANDLKSFMVSFQRYWIRNDLPILQWKVKQAEH